MEMSEERQAITDAVVAFINRTPDACDGRAEVVRAAIIEGLAKSSGDGVMVHGRNIDEPVPTGGALLHVNWAVSDQSYVEWYPSTAQAMSALQALAVSHARKVQGRRVDLTLSGCYESSARVEPRDE